ncbi:hypothetical protein PTSG_11776 [Salpingoeca rosetta]|uniref:Asn/Gln amidotransferase domain-containing protein n=1 Tax=Salpingoeca rosetta (strain ATCC 50818 / BSB-021) TaxID=946362 RepID=F2TYS7_SALR5|nr:uncharacterized protein PTSG_11776 [Salpingoeca rosetta]EGD78751.1 hypothetical protein PTSG_11776 [Salpingoeca rosetta]|eukprot:XP_004997708.1 hypothetical protein PTSG_11776 [Salpingoeca rosetta]
MLDGDRRSPTELMEALDLRQESDAAVLQALVVDVVANNPKQRNKFLKGQTGVLGFFVGQVMGKTKGKANPQKVKQAVEQELAKFSHQASC